MQKLAKDKMKADFFVDAGQVCFEDGGRGMVSNWINFS